MHQLSRENKHRILTTEPDSDPSSFPRTRPSESVPYRQFQPNWLKQYPWLHYSQHDDGVYCRSCVLFAPKQVGGQDLGQFVRKPFKSWGKILQKASAHGTKSYHLSSMTKMTEFLARYENPSQSVNVIMDNEVQRIMNTNQKVLESLIKIVLLCGKQGLALRGHRDDKIGWTDDASDSNEGNFVELVRFRAETDPVLAQHLDKSPRNARYTSKRIQNEIVQVIGECICNDIIAEVKQAKFFSVIADEVTDTANKEELSLSLRFVHAGTVKEVFVDFVEVERITGRVLAQTILQWLSSHGLSPVNIRGQCYDGASNMSGAASGCKSIVQQEAPLALYFHCAAHRLNLAVVSACKIQSFKNAESYVGEIARFFNFSAKRQRALDRAIEICTTGVKAKKLKDACRTRWVYRIDAYVVFLELLPAVHTVLDAIVHPTMHEDLGTDWKWDGESIMKANGFLFQLQSPSFLIAFKILLHILYILRELTVKLQMQAIDVTYAYQQVSSVVSTLKEMREDSSSQFHSLFLETTQLGQQLHGDQFQLSTPRIVGRQAHRSNPETASPEDYFRITLFSEFLSHVISQLEDRFVKNPAHSIALGLLYLLPSKCIHVESEGILPTELAHAADLYKEDLPHSVMLSTEYNMWVLKWKQQNEASADIPNKLVDALNSCSELQFPNLHVLLRVALTLPITSCESERSFSQLKLIKTSHRSTMTSSRLSGLALMKINRDSCNKLSSGEKIKDIVKLFAQLHPRRLKLPFMLGDES